MEPGKNETEWTKPMFLAEASAFCEIALQNLWNVIPLNVSFPLKAGGSSFKVLSRGLWNHDAGPDFLNAKIEIDGTVLHGDVEIHCRTSDWARHDHSGNPDYDRVILHAVGVDDAAGTAADAIPFVPVFVLPRDFSSARMKTIPRGSEGLCAAFFARLPDEAVHRFIGDAGLERMQSKSNELLTEMIASGAKNAFILKLFELIGIPGNRAQFRELAVRVLAYPEETRTAHFHAILWGESGCLPDPVKTELPPDAKLVVGHLWDEWWTVRRKHEEPITFVQRCRPLNSIGRRIAILSRFISIFGENPLPALLEAASSRPVCEAVEYFLKTLTVSDPFWSKHSSFRSASFEKEMALIGRDRVLELLVDVFIPGMRAYATVTKDYKQIAKIDSLYLELPKTASNKTLRAAMALCFPGRGDIFRTAASQQG